MPTNVMSTVDVANFHLPELSKSVRMEAQTLQRYRQFATPEIDYGPHQSDRMSFVKVTNLEDEGRRIGENDSVPVTKMGSSTFDVRWEEYTNSVQLNQRADMVSQLCVGSILYEALKLDAARTLDRVAAQPFITSNCIYTPTGNYTSKTSVVVGNGIPGAVAQRPFQMEDLRNMAEFMSTTLRVPTYGNTGEYICVCNKRFMRGLQEDPEYFEAAKYAAPDRLFSGEMGNVLGFRFIEESNVLKNMPGGGGEATFFGNDAVTELETYPLELQVANVDTYGRVKSIRWVWMGGFASPYDIKVDNTSRIVRVASAAA